MIMSKKGIFLLLVFAGGLLFMSACSSTRYRRYHKYNKVKKFKRKYDKYDCGCLLYPAINDTGAKQISTS